MFKLDIPTEKVKEKYSDAESKFLIIDKMEIHYKDEGEGEAIVLLHDAGTSLHIWDKWADLLKLNYRVIRVDLPGFGLSERSPKFKMQFDEYVYFIKKFTAALDLGLKQFHIAGNGFGGQLAWQYTLLHQHKVLKMCLINGLHAANEIDNSIFKIQNKNGIGRFLLRWKGTKKSVNKRFSKIIGDTKILNDSFILQTQTLLLKKGNRETLSTLSNMPYKNRSVRLNEIETPTLIMKSGLFNDTFFDDKISNSTVKLYESVGLMPMIECAEESAKDFLHFL
jgi:pimeloyl-ACP methyl ester carboxylesterase